MASIGQGVQANAHGAVGVHGCAKAPKAKEADRATTDPARKFDLPFRLNGRCFIMLEAA